MKALAALLLAFAAGNAFAVSDRAALNLAIAGTRDAPPDLFDLIVQHRREFLSGVRETISWTPAADFDKEARALSRTIVSRAHFPDVIHRIGTIVGELIVVEAPKSGSPAERLAFEEASEGPYMIPGVSAAAAAGNPGPVAASIARAPAELRERKAAPGALASRLVADETNLLWAIWIGAGGDTRPARKFEEKNGPYTVPGAPR
ncbi:MAG: hypothetical protein ACRD16_08020 [Thermoanaerobaculia bacterium]